MIEAVYLLSEDRLIISGHAQAGEYGHDLVCAAASVLLHTARRALGGRAALSVRSGRAELRALGGERDRDILNTVMAGYEWLAENYPENLRAERR